MENIGKLVTVKEAAEAASLSKSMVYKLIYDRVLCQVRYRLQQLTVRSGTAALPPRGCRGRLRFGKQRVK